MKKSHKVKNKTKNNYQYTIQPVSCKCRREATIILLNAALSQGRL